MIARCEQQPGAALRPVLNDRERLRNRFESRLPHYRSAHLVIETASLTPEETSQQILKAVTALLKENTPRMTDPPSPFSPMRRQRELGPSVTTLSSPSHLPSAFTWRGSFAQCARYSLRQRAFRSRADARRQRHHEDAHRQVATEPRCCDPDPLSRGRRICYALFRFRSAAGQYATYDNSSTRCQPADRNC